MKKDGKHSEETKRRMSEAKKGEKAYQWKGGRAKCLGCGKLLPSYSRSYKNGAYCNPCSPNKKGRKLTKEHKENISKGNKGKKRTEAEKQLFSKVHKGQHSSPKTEFKKGLIPWNKGKRYLAVTGPKNNNWKGGVTPLRHNLRDLFEYKKWRSDVYRRDYWTCQTCCKKGGEIRIEAHHIKRFVKILEENKIKNIKEALSCEELWDVNNGVTLCKKCHLLAEKKKRKNEK